MTYLKEGEKSHCGICKYCKRLWKSTGIYAPPNFKAIKSLCCVLRDDEIWEVNNANFCDYFDRKEDGDLT